MTREIKKAVIPVMGLSEELFPLTRSVPRELLPLGDVPLVQRIVDEAKESGAEEIIFILSSFNRPVIGQFRNLDKVTEKERNFKQYYSSLSFSYVLQKKKSKSGYTLSRAEKKTGEDSFFLSFPGTVFYSKKPVLKQLHDVFKTSEKPVAALTQISEEEVSRSFVAETEKIAHRFYKIKKIYEKPAKEQTDSRLAIKDRYILTSLVFDYLRETGEGGTLVGALNRMIVGGKTIYGYEAEGKWFDCKDKSSYLKANSFFMLEQSLFSNELKNYIKDL